MLPGVNDSPRTRPARPRDAATLLVYRPGPKGMEVIMGRRSDKARFRPGVYVFPGGRLEAADHRITPLTPLPSPALPKLGAGESPRRAQALALAAIRETFEESGLIVGTQGDAGPSAHPSWEAIRARGFAPALHPLVYLGRAITPSVQPIRFHARFFAVEARYAHGELGGDSELEDLRWVPFEDVAQLEVMPVTLLMIESLNRYLAAPDTHRSAFLRFQYGRRTISWG